MQAQKHFLTLAEPEYYIPLIGGHAIFCNMQILVDGLNTEIITNGFFLKINHTPNFLPP